MTDPLNPSPALLCKLASVAVHADEFMSPFGHEMDRVAFNSAINDPEVKEWLDGMTALAMAPRKRNP